jgi:acetylornithine/succinyldiaminopimelate/putrescine aminotransferase
MKLIEDERLVERAEREGGRIMQAIRDAKLPVVKEVRGAGMMIGIEITKPGKEFFTKCLERGLLINCTRETVLRLAPPLVATDQDLRQGLDILLQVLRG